MSTTTNTAEMTADQIAAALNADETSPVPFAKTSRDGQSVVIGYGAGGYARLTPSSVWVDGQDAPAAIIEGGISGRRHKEIREALRAVGIAAR